MAVTIPDEVARFVAQVPDETRRTDAQLLVELFAEATGETPALDGKIVGFGRYHYRYDSGREGDTVRLGFSPRAAATSVYLCGYLEEYADLLERLGPYKRGKGCLYLNSIAGLDPEVLRQMAQRSLQRSAEVEVPQDTST